MEELPINPFSGYAQIVYGDMFVDRFDEITVIDNRVLRAPEPGCVAIVGPPRIGKSSLAFHTLRSLSKEHLQRMITIWCGFGTVSSIDEVFRVFVRMVLDYLEEHKIDASLVESAGQRALVCANWFDLQHNVQRFFKILKNEGWRVAIVLDEFDAARQVFQQNPLGFQALRSLADNPDWRVAFITCSRRSIPEIEIQSGADISNFHNIFHYLFLKPFQLSELRVLLGRLARIGIELDEAEYTFIQQMTGGHPFLASALGFQIAKSWIEYHTYSIEDAFRDTQAVFIDYYDDLVRLLRHEDALEKLLQILFGPMINATIEDAERFVRYGLIINNNGSYKPFSVHFGEFLRLTERSVDFWPLWKDAERRLRSAIAQVMQRIYQMDDWSQALERARPKLKQMLDDCRTRQTDEQRRFGARASVNILDYTYPGDLYQIIRTHWSAFQPLLCNNEQYWDQRFALLARVRNPFAHNRDEVLALHERQIAEGYCREILYRLTEIDKC